MNRFSIEDRLSPLYQTYPESHAKPLIGITANYGGEDFSIRQYYCEQVEKSGGVPILLTPTDNAHIIAQQLDVVDGILLSGGADHNPLWMNEEPQRDLHAIKPLRDSHEMMLTQLAYNRHLPILGICRGIQTLAVALGGHVRQDIYTSPHGDLSNATIKHSQDAPKPEPTHTVSIVKDSMLYNIYKDTDFLIETRGERREVREVGLYVNSFHHQAVDRTGQRFYASAFAPDGVIEAMESTECRQILGVQWHPEQLGKEGLVLFKWLTDSARLFHTAKELHSNMLTIDSHCDTPMFFPQNVDFLARDNRILYDLHKMDDGRIDAVHMVCYLPQPKLGETFSSKVGFEVNGPLEYADLIFDKIEEICSREPDRLSIARTPADLYRDKREGRHSIVLGIENGLALDHDLRNIQHFKQRGCSYITLCHNGDNDICDSARGCNTHGGISSFGRKVIEEMNRQGIMVDLSHAAESSFYQALELSRTPIVCSHSNCRALCDHPRNLTDDQMRALAERGGVMQLTLYAGFLSTTGEVSIDNFMQHLDHAINIMGIDHVGIGTDFDGDGGVLGLADASELINITEQLLRRHFSNEDIAKIWGKNWLRVMSVVQRG